MTNAQAKGLRNAAPELNKLVNAAIQSAYENREAVVKTKGGVAAYVFKLLTERPAETLGNDVKVTLDLQQIMGEAKDDSGKAGYIQGKVQGTKYQNKAITRKRLLGKGQVPLSDFEANNGAISAGFNIGGEAIGGDKLDHMFYDGYDLLEYTNPAAARAKAERDEAGLFGLEMSGVYSHADIEASMMGYQFYRDLKAAWSSGNSFRFDIEASAKKLRMLNENINKNEYNSYTGKKVLENEKELKLEPSARE